MNPENGINIETTEVNGVVYAVDDLKNYADKLPSQEIDTVTLRAAIAEGRDYWIDRKGNTLGPYTIMKNWEAAQQKPEWSDHVTTIKNADLENPIWMTIDGFVFDGMHRLTRAFIERKEKIKVKIFNSLPNTGITWFY